MDFTLSDLDSTRVTVKLDGKVLSAGVECSYNPDSYPVDSLNMPYKFLSEKTIVSPTEEGYESCIYLYKYTYKIMTDKFTDKHFAAWYMKTHNEEFVGIESDGSCYYEVPNMNTFCEINHNKRQKTIEFVICDNE